MILIGRMMYAFSSFITSSSVYSFTLSHSVSPLIHQVFALPPSLEFSTSSSPLCTSSAFSYFLHTPLFSALRLSITFTPSLLISIHRCLFSLTPCSPSNSPCPLQADLPRSMAGYLTGLLREDSAIECKSPGWEEEGKKG